MAGNKATKQVSVIAQSATNATQVVEDVAFFAVNGSPIFPGFVPYTTATAIATSAKTIAAAEPAAGTFISINFTNGNSAATPTVSFNSGTARSIVLGNVAHATAAKFTLGAGGIAFFYFDGTSLHQFGVYS